MLYVGVDHHKRYCQPAIRKSAGLRAHYERVKARHGANGAKAAVARKLCELVWHVLRERRPYEERSPPACPLYLLARRGSQTG